MTDSNITDLIGKALEVTGKFDPSESCSSGNVGAALITSRGHIYTGVCVDCTCSIGFCAEHSAVAEMLKHHESEISMIVAVNTSRKILPPCGRCRELLYEVNPRNLDTFVISAPDRAVPLSRLLPSPRQEEQCGIDGL
jgi:cytidine deaminase